MSGSTGFGSGSFKPGHSGTVSKKGSARRRPYKAKRVLGKGATTPISSQGLVVFSQELGGQGGKRKQGKRVNRKDSWVMLGDFNEILNNDEKIGGPRRNERSFQPFADMLFGCGMSELPGSGNSFTWSGLSASQHSYRGSFRFDKRMLHKPLVWEEVDRAWKWPDQSFGASVAGRLKSCRKALMRRPSVMKIKELNSQMCVAYKEEESFWKQKICNAVMEVLAVYEAATGQTINLEKSSVIFGAHIHQDSRDIIHDILGIVKVGGEEKYLGLPEVFSGSKIKSLSFLQENLKDKLTGYQARLMSQGGKEVVIKSVAMSMSVYAMSVFRLPKTTTDNIVSLANFWWNSDQEKKKTHWVSWERMCLPKKLGGMGFKDIQVFNQALLAKQAWRLVNFPDSLLAKFLKMDGIRQMIGNGRTVKVWTERWLFDVADLLNETSKWWDIDKLNELFYPDDVNLILKIKPVVEEEDFWSWHYNKNGDYSVRSGYWLGCQKQRKETLQAAETLPSLNFLKESIWKIKTSSKIKIFLNKLNFEGFVLDAMKLIEMSRKEADEWTRAQKIEDREQAVENHSVFNKKKPWEKPQGSWLKCNIGHSWNRHTGEVGSAWVLRNGEGLVLMHSRKSSVQIWDDMEAKMVSWLWAVESMVSLKIHRVMFAGQEGDILGMIERPRAWPSFKFWSNALSEIIKQVPFWKLHHEQRLGNRGAYLIARSVTSEDRRQSYVAAGHPVWLRGLFIYESR
ncbi:hypothetical protein Bca52824_033515 [Brassica carinata]|uniref:RNase H type-1 domain-containing protein n=1 Tax=Brassica carinata TaxID=52824 RepID=A0A8X7SD01_BRACI|nr:hypothetical protein Bca52824_033515 [Brassica carinata]